MLMPDFGVVVEVAELTFGEYYGGVDASAGKLLDELFRLEAVVRWLDAADVRLQDSPKVEVAPRPKRPRLTRLLDTHR